MKSRISKSYSLFSTENILGLILAVLIIFQILPGVSSANMVNNPIGIIISLILAVVLFVLMNPIVGFLFLIYLYEIIQISNNYNKQVIPVTRNKELQNLNTPPSVQLEETVIRSMAPIKNEFKGNNVEYMPVLEKIKV
jgi:hypothetical protein